jgi:hypothetical protein
MINRQRAGYRPQAKHAGAPRFSPAGDADSTAIAAVPPSVASLPPRVIPAGIKPSKQTPKSRGSPFGMPSRKPKPPALPASFGMVTQPKSTAQPPAFSGFPARHTHVATASAALDLLGGITADCASHRRVAEKARQLESYNECAALYPINC